MTFQKEYEQAIEELSKATNVNNWNKIRSRWVDVLTREELALIDSGGLIVKVLGKDKFGQNA